MGGSTLPAEVMPSEPPDASDYEMVTRTVEIESLLDADGIRYLFTSFVPNFMGFTAMGIISPTSRPASPSVGLREWRGSSTP